MTALYQAIAARLARAGLKLEPGTLPVVDGQAPPPSSTRSCRPARVRYLADIADTVRDYHAWAQEQARIARERQQLRAAKAMLSSRKGRHGHGTTPSTR